MDVKNTQSITNYLQFVWKMHKKMKTCLKLCCQNITWVDLNLWALW